MMKDKIIVEEEGIGIVGGEPIFATYFRTPRSRCEEHRDDRSNYDCIEGCWRIDQGLSDCTSQYGYTFSSTQINNDYWYFMYDAGKTCDVMLTKELNDHDAGSNMYVGLIMCEDQVGGWCQDEPCLTALAYFLCTPDCTCASEVCIGETCPDGCGGVCQGTKDCLVCNTIADKQGNCDGMVSKEELQATGNKWINEEVSRSDLGLASYAWSSS